MADPKIKLKRSSVEGKIPTSGQVPLGEIALNTYDGYLYASKNVGIGTTVIAINPFRVGTGTNTYNAYFTAGNIGIGTINPTAKLQIDVGSATTAFDIQGSEGQLFSVTNQLSSGSIFSVNDISGIPSIDVDADGTIQLAPIGAGESVGIGTTNPQYKLHVVGNTNIDGTFTVNGAAVSGGGISNVVEDTTPQLGGTLETNGNLIDFGDSSSATDDRLRFGQGNDLQIYHNGADSYISQQGTGNLTIANITDDQDVTIQSDDGSGSTADYFRADGSTGESILYHYGSQKLATKSTGIEVTGVVTATSFSGDGSDLSNVDADTLGGQSYFNWLRSNVEDFKTGGPLVFSDNIACAIGSGKDLEIYHNGTNNFIDNNKNNLYIRNNVDSDFGGDIYIQAKSSENSIVCQDDGEVQLYYDGSEKLNTTANGIAISGIVTASSGIVTYYGDGSNLTGISGGISNVVEDTTPQLGGNLDVNAKNINFGDSASASDDRLNFGAGTDLSIYFDGTNSYIDVIPDASNHLYLRNNVGSDQNGNIYIQAKSGENSIVCYDDTAVELYYDSAWKLTTTSTGVTVNGTGLGNWKVDDNNYLTAGTGNDLQIYHDGTDTYLDNDTGHFYIRNNVAADVGGDIIIMPKSGETGIRIYDDTAVELYYDAAWKLTTTSTGVTVNGTGLGNWKVDDNNYLTAGTGNDLQIYHDGTDTYLDNDTGHLYIRNNVAADVGGDIVIMPHDNETGIRIYDDGGVYLYYDNAAKLYTTSAGVTISGTLSVTTLAFGDDQTMTFGASSDLQIYHNGTDNNSYIDSNTNHLYIRNNVDDDDGGNIYIQAKSGEHSIACNDDSSVGLYYDSAWKLTTTSTGVTVNGTGLGSWKANDNVPITTGTGDDFQIKHDGTDTYLDNDTGHIYIRNNVAADVGGDIFIQAKSGETSIRCYDDSAVELYYDAAWKLTTTSSGITISGTGIGSWKANDNSNLIAGSGDDLKIYHDGSNSYIDADPDATNQHLYIRNNVTTDYGGNIYIQAKAGENSIICYDDTAVELYYDAAWRLTTSTSGITVNGTATAVGFATASGTSSQFLKADGSIDSSTYNNYTNSDVDSHLNQSNPTSGYVLSWNGSDYAWVAQSGGDVVDDTTPQLGGNLDVNGKNINFGDSASSSDDRLHFGASSDLEIYHNGSNSRICDRGTGNLQLITNSNIVFLHQDNEADAGAAIAKFFSDGANELYYNATKRFETTNDGVVVTGIATATSFSGSGSNLTGLTGASAATYGDASNVAQIVVDSNGRITSISNVAISGGGGGGSSLWTQTGYTGIGTTSAVGIGTIIEIIPYDTQNNGTLSFEGSAGQLFSITNQLSSGSIFSVNDVSGIPSIDVDADGTIQLAPFSSNESVGIGTTNPQYKLHVVGDTNIDGTFTVNGAAVGGGGGVTTGKAIAMAMVFG